MSFLNQKYKEIKTYTPGEQPSGFSYLKLNTNESPYPPAPSVIEAVSREVIADLRLYPDPDCNVLRTKLAALYGVSKENIFLANGSDDILNFAFMAFGEGRALFPEISYGFYEVFANLHGVSYTKFPLKEDFSIDYRLFCGREGLVVIANPNAPTGIALSVNEIEEIVKSNPENVVLIDEAYVDFGAESCFPLINRYENLLVVQTFSKSRSMAGARLGFAIGSKALISDLEKIKYSTNPYNINRMTLAAGEATVDENDYYMENCRKIIEAREYTVSRLSSLGFHVLPSTCNFIFAKTDSMIGADLYRKLKENGILVRHFDREKIQDYNRITIGTKEQMERFTKVIETIIGGKDENK